MHTLAVKMFVFNQSKSAPVNKDQFKPYYSCRFYFNGDLPIFSGYVNSPYSCNLQRYSLYQHTICKVICLKNTIE